MNHARKKCNGVKFDQTIIEQLQRYIVLQLMNPKLNDGI